MTQTTARAEAPVPLEGWVPPPLPWRKTLDGALVRVEPLTADDHVEPLWQAISADADGARWTYRLDGPFDTRDAFHAYLRRIEGNPAVRFGVYVPRSTGRAAGLGALMSIQPASGAIEIGAIMMAPAISGTAASTEALALQIGWAFSLGYRRVEWTCDPLNRASMRAAERLGFTYEAHFRQAYVTKGRNRDKAVFSITDGDWPAIGDAIRTWLSEIGGDGAERRPLRELTAPLVSARAPEAHATAHDDRGNPVGAAVEGWRAPPPPSRASMEGRLVRLEPLSVDHATALHDANREDDRIWDWLPYGPFESEEAFAAWVAEVARHPDPLFFAILVEGRPVGVASYLRIVPAHGVIEVGHINLSKRLQRTPAATEAMYLMMRWAFAAGYRRYEWKCNALNRPSRRAAERLGLSFEGVTRQATVSKGANRDTAWFAATDAEWPALKAAFERWLAPETFDGDGQQRESLSALTAPVLVRRDA